MDVVLLAYNLEESIRMEGGPRLVILPFVRKTIEMLLQDDKDRAMEYLKLAVGKASRNTISRSSELVRSSYDVKIWASTFSWFTQ